MVPGSGWPPHDILFSGRRIIDKLAWMKTREAAEMHMASVISLRISFQDVSS